jgi:hypothetical protein
MWMVYLLWVVIVLGGLFMGLGAGWTLVRRGFDPALAGNAVLYLGCALYGMPRLLRLLLRRG